MPYYLITVLLKDKKSYRSIRELKVNDIDHAWLLYKSQAEEHFGFGNIEDFDCVQVSEHSPELKAWLNRKKDK